MSGMQATAAGCEIVRPLLSPYVDGEVDAAESGLVARHVDGCRACAAVLQDYRALRVQLQELPAPEPPVQLGLKLRIAASHYSVRGQNWSYFKMRVTMAMQALAVPVIVGTTSALVMASLLVGGVRSNVTLRPAAESPEATVGLSLPPRLSQAPNYDLGAQVVVEANIDAQGRVYGYRLLSGPTDAEMISRLNNELLLSIFEPAMTAFGQPTTGSLVVSFGSVEVKG